jgi:glycosyltransferase involved in cell wall biosynthesis
MRRVPAAGPGKEERSTLSVVLPVFNERENLELLMSRLRTVLDAAMPGSFEVVFVDDGSRDGSAKTLDALAATDPRFKVIHLSRNFGHQAALQAGLDEASGDAVVLMDADLQDPPELLPGFIDEWRRGADIVYAVRTNRKEGLLKRAAYRLFYRSMNAIAHIDVPLDAGDFCLLDRKVVDILVALPEYNRFLRGLRAWVGFEQRGLPYERAARHGGKPKYTLRKLMGLALAGYVGFSAFPLRVAAWLGFAAIFVSAITVVWVLWAMVFDMATPRGWVSIMALMMFFGGIQFLILGVLGEYLGRVYDEVRRRPLYIVRSRAGFDSALGGSDSRRDQ